MFFLLLPLKYKYKCLVFIYWHTVNSDASHMPRMYFFLLHCIILPTKQLSFLRIILKTILVTHKRLQD